MNDGIAQILIGIGIVLLLVAVLFGTPALFTKFSAPWFVIPALIVGIIFLIIGFWIWS